MKGGEQWECSSIPRNDELCILSCAGGKFQKPPKTGCQPTWQMACVEFLSTGVKGGESSGSAVQSL